MSMTKFPETAIRKRLAQGYRRENKRNGRGIIDVDAAIKDVAACLAEIDLARQCGFDPRVEWVQRRPSRPGEAFATTSMSDKGKTSPAADAGTPRSKFLSKSRSKSTSL